MNYQKTAQQIIDNIGGKDNISHIEHCSTRLRFTLKDDGKVNKAALETIEGVIGVRHNVQCQVIIGNEVVEVYEEVLKLVGDTVMTSTEEPKKNRKIGAILLDFVISIFQPLVPALAGGGILKSLLMLASLTGLMNDQSQTYQILNLIGGASLYFLPILVAMTTAKKMKVNQLVAVSIAGAMILPDLTVMLADGAKFLSFNIENIAYASQVFPAILTILFYAYVERFFTKYSFKSIRIFFVPMMSMLITVPIGLLILGPLGYNVGSVFSGAIISLYSTVGWVATALLAAILPLMVVTGMHKAMIPYAVSSMSELGAELLYLPASLAHNIAESGACFAVSLKTKDKDLRSTAISAGISALFGITEPALYGVTIIHKRVLMAVMSASLVGGALAGILAIKAFALVGPGLASITMFADPSGGANLKWAFVVFGVSFVVAFLAAFFLYKDAETVEKSTATKSNNSIEFLTSPVKGQVVPLSEVQDEVFSSGMVGKGVAIIPEEGMLYAPENGEVTTVFETKHAIGMKLSNGAELLFHIGLDTVQMKGNGFEAFVEAGDQVKQGDPLIKFNIVAIQESGFDPIVICVVTNGDRFDVQTFNETQRVTNDSDVLSINTI
ncbi:beta-glucoside-specific PTS transporter subunit IIABC [Enterococcus sp. DIV0756]|uniref:beta-glucoside-specific PTS transporter subunit IIABC n=1 Tax=Enterococcus sp. DIV0756 TaxID=2774636 RepID=UPI003F271615